MGLRTNRSQYPLESILCLLQLKISVDNAKMTFLVNGLLPQLFASEVNMSNLWMYAKPSFL